jgi:drug/metabolite transporter (DMT)-like permease
MSRTAWHSKPAAIALQTAAAMIAFAANSLLCRIALAGDLIDAPSFATLRIASGAVLLAWLARRSGRTSPAAPTDWVAAVSLVVYLLPFTLAYLTLDAGSGALLLFGAAQLTMLGTGLYRGERPSSLGWIGLVAAAIGFVSLLAPGADAPPLLGGGLMTLAGIAWGVYSLRGRHSDDPVASTARSFLFALPWVLVINLAFASQVHSTAAGATLALASGILASALGYVIWYATLPFLSAITAGSVQLSVPLIAAVGGALLLGEQLSLRLAGCAVAILGGIALASGQRTLAARRA